MHGPRDSRTALILPLFRIPRGKKLPIRIAIRPPEGRIRSIEWLISAGLRSFEIKLQKGVDRLNHPPYMAAHRNGDAAKNGRNASVANTDGQQSPGIPIGERWLSASFCRFGGCAGGSLTLSVLDEGTCGRRRPVRRASGSGYGLFKSLPYMSFVSITFDKCRYRLLKFGVCGQRVSTRAVSIVTQT